MSASFSERPRGGRSERLLFLRAFFHGGLEILDARADALAELRQPVGSENENDNRQNNEHFRQTDRAHDDSLDGRETGGRGVIVTLQVSEPDVAPRRQIVMALGLHLSCSKTLGHNGLRAASFR